MLNLKQYDVRVRMMRWECEGVVRLELEPIENKLPLPEPGAHIDIKIPNAPIRQYSLTIGSTRGTYVLGVRREKNGRGGSAAIHTQLRVGDIIQISPPRNSFPLVESGAVHLFAGGIGITPLMFMAEKMEQTQRQWHLTYCARSPQETAFLNEARALKAQMHFDCEHGVPDFKQLLGHVPKQSHIYCCGPEQMLDAFLSESERKGFAGEHVHIERFGPAKIEVGEGEFIVVLAKSGGEIVVKSGQTILQALISEGHNPPNSCGVGVCGTCETRVLEGEVEHKDMILTPEEKEEGLMMICCSRAKSDRIVLDL